jgi:poly(A) polymerase
LIDEDALKVLYRLNKGGFRGYMVGGSVRDLMLGRRPKDFDVSTDARPPEIRRLFRNARIIGRRFRLAHILFRDNVIELSTFRREPDPEKQAGGPDERLITSDNTFGTPAQDAFRRDFTINALFYDIADFSVVDYVGGIEDLEQGLVRVIGDPDVRFQEDPVRIMRACEFAGRLGFAIESETQRAIQRNVECLRKGSPARLAEEILQLLRCGAAGASVQWMLELDVLEVLLPEALAMIRAQDEGAGDFSGILPTLDAMVAEGRELSDPALLAALLLPEVMLCRFAYEREHGRWMPLGAFQSARQTLLVPFFERFAFANHKRSALGHVLDGFHRLCDTRWTPAKRRRFAGTGNFQDSLLLFEILVRSTGHGHDTLESWRAVALQRGRRTETRGERHPRGRTRRGGRRRGRSGKA